MRLLSIFLILLPTFCFAQEDPELPKMDISVVNLLVTDYDEAVEFYTQKLGFVVSMDRSFGENQRWVSIKLPNSKVELSLGLSATKEDLDLVGRQGGQFPFFVITTENFDHTYQNLVSKDVEFMGKPGKNPWGTTVVLKDLYGNQILLKGD